MKENEDWSQPPDELLSNVTSLILLMMTSNKKEEMKKEIRNSEIFGKPFLYHVWETILKFEFIHTTFPIKKIMLLLCKLISNNFGSLKEIEERKKTVKNAVLKKNDKKWFKSTSKDLKIVEERFFIFCFFLFLIFLLYFL